MTRSLFIDAGVLVYAHGGQHPERQACRALIAAATRSEIVLHASVEAIQEFTFHRVRIGDRASAIAQAKAALGFCVTHAFDDAVLVRALDLTASTPIGGRDAVHAATALLAGFDEIVAVDRDFDGVPGLSRLTPVQALG